MSWEASSWAMRQTAGGPGPKCLLLALSNHVDKRGVGYPGRATLAEECECRPATVSANFARLEQAGLVERHQRHRANGSRTSDWVVLGPRAADRGEMRDADPAEYPSHVAAAARGGTETVPGSGGSGTVFGGGQVRFSGRPEPSGKRSESPPTPPQGPRLTEAGDLVTAAIQKFNDVFGTRYSPTTAGWRKPIAARIKEHPELTLADHERVMRAAGENPYWDPDREGKRPSPSNVYGPRAFEIALEASRDSVRAPKQKTELTKMWEED